MDVLSLIIGGVLGGLAGWAFSSATAKKREASKRRSEMIKATEKMFQIEGEAKSIKERSFTDTIQGFLLYVLGFAVIFIMLAISLNAIG